MVSEEWHKRLRLNLTSKGGSEKWKNLFFSFQKDKESENFLVVIAF